MDWKKILKIILFVGIAVGFGFAIYFFFFRGPGGTPGVAEIGINEPQGAPGGRLPSAGGAAPRRGTVPIPGTIARGGLTLAEIVVQTPIAAAFLPTGSNAAQYYDPNDGKFYRVSPDGTRIAISDKRFFNVQTVSWNREGNQAILEYPDGSNIQVNFKTNVRIVDIIVKRTYYMRKV